MIDRVAQRIEEMRRRPDLRNPDHVRRYDRLVVRNPDGSTEGVHPKDADPAVMGEIHMPLPIMKVIRAKCIDCSAGSEAEVRKCVAINCALWPYRMGSNQPLPHPDHLGRTSLTISGCFRQCTAGQGQAGAAPMTRAES